MSAWSKLFQNFTWHNKGVARDTPLSAANMQKLNDAIDGVDDRAITLKDGVDSLSGNIGTLAGNVGELQSLIRKTTEENVSVVNVKYNGTGTSKVKLDGDSILITGVDGTRITDTDSVTLASEDEIVIDIDTGGAYSGKLHVYRNLPSATLLLEDHLAFVIGPQDATKQGVLFKCIRKDVGQQTLYEWEPISLKVSANSDGSYDIPSVVLRSNTLTLVTAGGDEAVLDGAGIVANASYTISGETGVTIDAPDGDIILDADEVNLTGNITGGYIRSGKKAGTTAGAKATAEGKDTIASGEASHTEGGSYTEDGHTYYTTASGKYSHAEGEGTVAGGEASHAEGVNAFIATFAKAAHAEGLNTSVNATCAHAEGEGAVASGRGAHAEGDGTTASGDYSHAGGRSTISQRRAQTVIGEYNVADTEGADGTARGQYAFIIGNGNSTNDRHNAFAVDWTGSTEIDGVLDVADNTYLHGDLTVSDIIVGESDIHAGGNVIADEYVIGEGHTGTTASGNPLSIPDALPADVKSCVVGIEPIQDLHGYDKPWSGGAGKNKLPLVLADIKSNNTIGTWSGNTYTMFNGTFIVDTDSDGNVSGIRVGQKPTGNDMYLNLGNRMSLKNGTTYILNANGGDSTSYIVVEGTTTKAWGTSDTTYTPSADATKYIQFICRTDTTITASLKPIVRTSGDPTFAPYTNICPISGIDSVAVERTGKNLLLTDASSKTLCGITYTVNEDGCIYANGTSDGSPNYAWIHVCSNTQFNKLGLVKGERYILSGNVKPSKGLLYIETFNNTHVYEDRGNGVEFTYNGETNLRIGYITNFNTTFNNEVVAQPMIRLATVSDATFEPYQGSTTTIPLRQTVYGGTLDVKSGVLTVDRAILDLGSFTWKYDSSAGFFVSTLGIPDIQRDVNFPPIIAEKYVDAEDSAKMSESTLINYISTHSNTCVANVQSRSSYNVWVNTGNNTTTPTGNICYKLVTPTTIQLSPKSISLLKGANVITVNGNTIIAVEYHPDIVPYVDRKVENAVEDVDAMISDNVEGDTASKAYAVNDFMLRADGFYKVTAPIANGAAITSSNTTKTTIGAVLTALLNA